MQKAAKCKGLLELFGLGWLPSVECALLSSQCVPCLREVFLSAREVMWFADL